MKFAILKIIRKDLTPDKMFEKHYAGCNRVGIPVPVVYNYSYAVTKNQAVKAAKKVVEVLDGRRVMVSLDWEDRSLTKLGKKAVEIINAYQEVIEAAGLPFCLYTYKAFYESYLEPYEENLKCPFWMARYPSVNKMRISENPSVKYKPAQKPLYGWQYSSKGQVSGIPGNVDMNIWYEDLAIATDEYPVSAVESKVSTYKNGKTYILQANMKLRSGHGISYRQKKRSELTFDGRRNAKDGTYAVLKKGTAVTVKSTYKSGSNIWIQIPSGWIAAVYNEKIYVK